MKPYYQDDYCTIYHGDCRDVLPRIESADHVITDPPYSRDVYVRAKKLVSRGGGRLGNRSDEGRVTPALVKLAAGAIGSVEDVILPASREFARMCKRWCIVWCDVEYLHEWRAALCDAGLKWVRGGAWVKIDPTPQMSGDRPAIGFEACAIVHRAGKTRWNGGGHAAAWRHLTVRSNQDRPDHPCPKPVSLMNELIQLFTDPGETVLDAFMGSGTTLVAAKNLGRKAIGIEIEKKYCDIAVKRLRQEVLAL